jgi:5-amino-6-(5-phospho-D-ribitylamino)uracil phosphatase
VSKMENIKMVAIDIDGTLLDDDLSISDKTSDKLKELKARGMEIVLATGRTYISAYNIMKKLGIETPTITENGSRLTIPSEGQVYKKSISLEDALEVIKFAERNDQYVKAYIDSVMYVKQEDDYSREFIKAHGIELKEVGKLSENIDRDVDMIVLILDKIYEGELDEEIKKMNVDVTMSGRYSLEFVPKGATKENALKFLAKELEIKREDILAIGNGLNDFEMIEYAGIGIAMKNSDPNLLAKCKEVSEFDNNEEGVYNIIKDL